MLTVRPLGPGDVATLSAMLSSQRPAYLRYFRPFAFDVATLTAILTGYTRDVFLGLYWNEQLAAFCMLRGWDEGYEVPAFGVVVDEQFSGRGFGELTLDLARVIGRLRGSSRMMLKVDPDNRVARQLYARIGFVETGRDGQSGNIVMHLALTQPLDPEGESTIHHPDQPVK